MSEQGKGGTTTPTDSVMGALGDSEVSEQNGIKATVCMLDSSQQIFHISKKAEGSELFSMVVETLQLLEKEYFSLRYVDNEKIRHWLHNDKLVSKQVKGKQYNFDFAVKFYPPDPTLLSDDVARHLMYLQICAELDSGQLPASLASYALLGSFIAQMELGDYGPEKDYLALCERHKFMDCVEKKLIDKIRDLHKQHRGKTASEAEMCFLDGARRLALYGIIFFEGKSTQGFPVKIGISAHGIDIYQEQVRLFRFLWQNIVNIAFRWNSFHIKSRQGERDKSSSFEYKLANYDAAKRVWKCAVENHAFFRLIQPDEKPPKKLFKFGTGTFRYQGRTQFQSKMASQMFDHPSATLPRDQSLNIPFQKDSLVEAPRHHSADNIPSHTDILPVEGDDSYYEVLRKTHELSEKSFTVESDVKENGTNQVNSSDHESVLEEKESTSNAEKQCKTNVHEIETAGVETEEGMMPHTTIESYHEGGLGSAYVVTDVDQHGNIIKRTTKTQQAKHTVQKQTYQTYTVPNEDGELGIQTIEASQQLITPIGEVAITNGSTPIIQTQSHVVSYESTDPAIEDAFDMSDLPGELISSRTITSGNRTFETITYKTEKNGIIETHVEHRVTIHSGGDIDHDAELCQAILEATDMNPDMTVEKIEVRQESQC